MLWLKNHKILKWNEDDIPYLAKQATREAFMKSAKTGGATIVIDGKMVEIKINILGDVSKSYHQGYNNAIKKEEN